MLPALLALLLVLLVAGVVAQLHDRGHEPAHVVPAVDIGDPHADPDGLAGSAVLVARTVVRRFYAFDPAHADRDVRRVEELATGGFAHAYHASAGRLVARAQSRGLRRSADLVADGTATEYLSTEVALVLVAAKVRTTEHDSRARVDDVRIRVRLQRVDGAWRVSALDRLGVHS